MKLNVLMSRSNSLVERTTYEYLKNYLKEDMKVVIIGFSFFGNLSSEAYFNYYGKDSEYALKMEELFRVYNISNINWIYYYDMDFDLSVKLINEADIIYFPGGAPDLMMERIIEKNLLEVLKNHDKITIGSSAGAMIQLGMYHISKDNEYFKFSLHEGLGYLNDFFIEVHYARRKPQKSSMRKMRKTYLKPVYVIPDDGVLIVDKNQVVTLNTARKYYSKKGIIK